VLAGDAAGEGAQKGLSLAELYERYAGSIHARCMYLLRNAAEAEDATQEVFVRALRHAESFRHEAAPLTWLITIATRHCLNQIRARGAAWHQQYAQAEQLKVVDGKAPEGRELIRSLLRNFDEETQAAAVLYHVDEMTLEEVSQALGRSIPTVRKRLAEFATRARERLDSSEKKAEEGAP
jgi:RNA polymerase sigma-70 factor (ECF subfamily)